MDKIDKKTDKAFNKKIYLLGQDKDGYNVYFEAPSWDCDWYWGFGYIETYTRKTNPSTSSDTNSHSHWKYCIVGDRGTNSSEYIYHINDNPNLISTVLTDKESWELSELMKKFYILQNAAELFHKGSANITNSPINDKIQSTELYNKINHELMPIIFKRIDEILTPEKEIKKDKKS